MLVLLLLFLLLLLLLFLLLLLLLLVLILLLILLLLFLQHLHGFHEVVACIVVLGVVSQGFFICFDGFLVLLLRKEGIA